MIIEADGEDRWIERDGWSDYRSHSREALIERIHQFGVAGLGAQASRPALSFTAAAKNRNADYQRRRVRTVHHRR